MAVARLLTGWLLCVGVASAPASADPVMLLTDKRGDRILAYDVATGDFQEVSASEDDTGFDTPVAIEVLGDHVYVAATTSDVVGRYRLGDPADHEVLVDKPTHGLGNPTGLAAGPDGRIYVADEGSLPSDPEPVLPTRILAVDPVSGEVEVYADFPGTSPATSRDGLTHARSVLFGRDGHLYVTNRTSFGPPEERLPGDNILRFVGPLEVDAGMPLPAPGKTGALYAQLGLLPTDLVFGPDFDGDGFDDLYVSFNRSGDRLEVVSGPEGPTPGVHLGPFLQTPIDEPWGMGFVGDELFVASFGSDEVWVYGLDGVFEHIFAPTGAEPPDATSGRLLWDPTDLILVPGPGGPSARLIGLLAVVALRVAGASRSRVGWRSRRGREAAVRAGPLAVGAGARAET